MTARRVNADRRRAAHPLGQQRLVDGDEQDVAVVEDEQARRRQYQRHAPAAGNEMMECRRGGQLRLVSAIYSRATFNHKSLDFQGGQVLYFDI